MKRSWREWSIDAIDKAEAQGKAEGLTGDDLEKYVRKNGYPFGLRKHHPYKMWCDVMKKRFPKKRPTKADGDRPLFGGMRD